MKLRSLETRIGICIAILMTIVVSILSGVAYHEFKEGLLDSVDLILQSDLQQVKGLLFSKTTATAEIQRELLDILNSQAMSEYQLWFENDANRQSEILFRTELHDEFTKKTVLAPALNKVVLLNLNHGDKPYRAIWARYPMSFNGNSSNQVVNIALAIGSYSVYHEAREFVRVLIIAGGIVVWAAWGLACQFSRWALKPINLLADQMSRVTKAELTTIKQDSLHPHQELVPFVKAWKDMLNRLAETMEEQKRFISDAAHELKTPIAVIKSTLQLAQSQKRNIEYHENTIDHTLEDVDRLNNLVNQLLELSRIESANLFAEREWMNIKEVIEDVLEHYKPCLDTKNFRLKSQLCSAEINGNREQIQHLFNNLVDNAIKYAPAGTTITVTLEIDEKWVKVMIHDEGGNIPEEDCNHLFDRFYRVSKARDRNSGGSGLGLAIAKEIVVQHFGQIRVESNRQKGTCFIVTLPGTESYRQS